MPTVGKDAVLDLAQRGFAGLAPWPEARHVALACSGGADSTFLALAWRRYAGAAAGHSPVWVVDHCHRPGTAAEAELAAASYRGLGYPVEVLAAQVAERDEAGLRAARYQAFAAAAARNSMITVLVTAHQADDLAETVLLRILRGTGLHGLAGVPARRRLAGGLELRRPLLGLRRAELREWLARAGVAWLEDPTNEQPEAAARNRLRWEILPQLAKVATGDPVAAVLRLAREAADWQEAQRELLGAGGPWRELPSYLRRQAVAAQLRALGATVSPARLRDLEQALLDRGAAAVDGATLLSVSGGRLHARDRKPQ